MTTERLGDPQPPANERRVAWVPILLATIGVLLAVIFGFVVAGLAGNQPPAAAPQPTSPASVPAPPVTEPAPQQADPVRPAAGPNECVDDRGDSNSIDLDSIALTVEDNRLRAVIVLAEPVPDTESTVGIVAQNSDGVRYQLATEWRDGELEEAYAYRPADNSGEGDDDDDRDDNNRRGNNDDEFDAVPGKDFTVEGGIIVVDFPKKVLDRLGESFEWYAFAEVDGDAVDACPGGAQASGWVAFSQ